LVEAEERLKKSEARYQNLYDSAPIPCFSISYTGDIIAANKAAETFTGYSEEEMKGMKIVDLYSEESTEKAKQLFKKFQQGIPLINEELVFKKKNGQKIHGLLSVNPIFDENGNFIENLSVVIDLEMLKLAEKEIIASEERYRTLFENVPIGLYHTTEIIDMNPAMIKMLGYSSYEELSELHLDDEDEFLAGYSRKHIREQLDKEGSIKGLETEWTTKDGSMITVREHVKAIRDESGEIRSFEGSVENITERKLAAARLRKARDHLEETVEKRTLDLLEEKNRVKSIIELIPDGILVLDAECRLVMANKAFKNMYREIFAGEYPLTSWIHQEKTGNIFLDTITEMITKSSVNEALTRTIEATPNLHLELSSVALQLPGRNEPFGTIIQLRDITSFVEYDDSCHTVC